jgi:hypothetical protein
LIHQKGIRVFFLWCKILYAYIFLDSVSNVPFPKVLIITLHDSPDLEEVIDIFRIFQFMDVEAWIFPLEIEFKDINFMNQADKKLYLLKEKTKEIKVEESEIIPKVDNQKDIVVKKFQLYKEMEKKKVRKSKNLLNQVIMI